MERKKIKAALCFIITTVILTGCGSSGKNEMAYDTASPMAAASNGSDYLMLAGETTEAAAAEEYGYDDMADGGAAYESKAEGLEENTPTAGRKLVKTVDLQVETENYDTLLSNLERQIEELGGYIEYQYQYNGSYYSNYEENRNAHLEVRIPVKQMDLFVVKVGEQSNITNKEERVEDVTLRYVDLESRKKALSTEQGRLLELLEKAETIEDVIAIEQRLSDVRYELESMESQLRTLNNLIDYSTINLSIREVKRVTYTEENSAWDKMKNGFMKTIYRIGDDIEAGFIRFVINIPYLAIWIAIIGIVFFICRAFIKKRKKKKMKTADAAKEPEKEDGEDAENGTGKE